MIINKKFKEGNIFWMILLIILAFVGFTSKNEVELVVPYINGIKYIFILLDFIVIFIFSRIKNPRMKIDQIMVILLIKALFDFITSYFINGVVIEYYIYFYISTEIGILCYLVCYNSEFDLKNILKLYRVFAIILCIQVCITSMYYKEMDFAKDISLKEYIRIPFASSNIIASILLPAALLCFVGIAKNKFVNIIELIIYMIALVFTKSRGGILLLVILIEVILFKRSKDIKKQLNRIISYLFLVIINIVFLASILNSNMFIEFFAGYKGYSNVNDFSARRIEVWEYSISEFLKNPIWGRGLYYDSENFIGSTGSHNIILETLMNTGIIGLSLHLALVLYMLKIIKKIKVVSKEQLGCIVILVSLYLNSMFEVCYYNVVNDVVFWSIAAFLNRDIKKQLNR